MISTTTTTTTTTDGWLEAHMRIDTDTYEITPDALEFHGTGSHPEGSVMTFLYGLTAYLNMAIGDGPHRRVAFFCERVYDFSEPVRLTVSVFQPHVYHVVLRPLVEKL